MRKIYLGLTAALLTYMYVLCIAEKNQGKWRYRSVLDQLNIDTENHENVTDWRACLETHGRKTKKGLLRSSVNNFGARCGPSSSWWGGGYCSSGQHTHLTTTLVIVCIIRNKYILWNKFFFIHPQAIGICHCGLDSQIRNVNLIKPKHYFNPLSERAFIMDQNREFYENQFLIEVFVSRFPILLRRPAFSPSTTPCPRRQRGITPSWLLQYGISVGAEALSWQLFNSFLNTFPIMDL